MELVNDSPRVLGNRYEVGDLLGRGGMAEVHLGRDARLGRTVAIKLLRSDLARDSTFQARFRREAQSAAALNHPAIVAVYDTGEEQVTESGGGVFNLPYIVMEHIEGRTLREMLAEGHHLDVDAALDITTGVLTALEYSHRIGIVHRDIKPANVMLTPVGDVKVMDFGIARAMADASSTMTQTQAVIGTAQYLSPEQARGEQVDTRSDLYSAGCLLFELLTGRPPFVADSPVAVAYQHVREQPIPPSRLVAGIGDPVDRIVLHALAKGREDRYQSAAEFRADVEAARGGRQVLAAVPVMTGSNATTQYVPVTEGGPRRPGPSTGAGGVGGLLGNGATTVGGSLGPYDPYGQSLDYGQRRERPQKASRAPAVVAALAVLVILALVGFVVERSIHNGKANNTTATQVAMPSLVDKTLAEAQQKLKDQGITSDPQVQRQASTTVDAGTVIDQNPTAGAQVAKTVPVVLTVSSGPDTVPVPNVQGKTQEQARAVLTAAGLTPGNATTEEDTSQPANRVTRTDPAAGIDATAGSTVDIFLSSSTVTMPDLIEQTTKQATAALKKLDLKVKVEKEPNSDVPVGGVLRTEPGANNKVDRGSTVIIVVAEALPATSTPTPTATPSPSPTTPTPTESATP